MFFKTTLQFVFCIDTNDGMGVFLAVGRILSAHSLITTSHMRCKKSTNVYMCYQQDSISVWQQTLKFPWLRVGRATMPRTGTNYAKNLVVSSRVSRLDTGDCFVTERHPWVIDQLGDENIYGQSWSVEAWGKQEQTLFKRSAAGLDKVLVVWQSFCCSPNCKDLKNIWKLILR